MTITLKPTSTAAERRRPDRRAVRAGARPALAARPPVADRRPSPPTTPAPPCTSTLAHSVTPLSRSGAALHGPLEPAIEAEPAPAIEQRRHRHAGALRRRAAAPTRARPALAGGGVAALRAAWTAKYPLAAADRIIAAGAVIAARAADPSRALPPARGPPSTPTAPAPSRPRSTSAPPAPRPPPRQDGRQQLVRLAQPARRPARRRLTRASTRPPGTPSSSGTRSRSTTSTPAGGLTLAATDYDGAGIDWFSVRRRRLDRAGARPRRQRRRSTPRRSPTPACRGRASGSSRTATSTWMRCARAPTRRTRCLPPSRTPTPTTGSWCRCPRPTPAVIVVTQTRRARHLRDVGHQVQAVADIDAGAGGWHLWELAGAAGGARRARARTHHCDASSKARCSRSFW